MSGDEQSLKGGRSAPDCGLQRLCEKLDRLATAMALLAESNAALAASVADLIDDGGAEEPQEPENGERGRYIG